MKDFKLKVLAVCMIIVGFFALMGWAGDVDFCDQVILSMTQEEYDYVKDSLTKLNGSKPSDREIAHWWADHHNNRD